MDSWVGMDDDHSSQWTVAAAEAATYIEGEQVFIWETGNTYYCSLSSGETVDHSDFTILSCGNGGDARLILIGKNINFSRITPDASNIVGSVTTDPSLSNLLNLIWSSGLFSGFSLTDNNNGTVSISSGEGVLRVSDSPTAQLKLITTPASNNIQLTDNSINYLYVNYDSGNPSIQVGTSESEFNCLDKCVLYRISRTGNTIHYINLMANNIDANRSLRRKDFEISNIDIGIGAKLFEIGNRYIGITAGSFWVILSRISTEAFDSSASDTFEVHYRDGSGGWTTSTGNSQLSNLYYDNNTGSPTTLTNGRFVTYFVFACLSENGYSVSVVMGQFQHKTREDAENEKIPSDLPSKIQAVGTILSLVTIEKNNTNFSSYINVEHSSFQRSLPTIHNNINGLQGGETGEYYHLPSDDFVNITDSNAQLGNLLTSGTPTFLSILLSKGIKLGNDTSIASSTNEGTIRFRKETNSVHLELSVAIDGVYSWQPIMDPITW